MNDAYRLARGIMNGAIISTVLWIVVLVFAWWLIR